MDMSAERPTLGRRIALELRPARPLTWVGPALATICGGLASGVVNLSGESILRFAIAVILTDPILGAWRSAWVYTDWRAPLAIWKPTPTRSWMLLPYARLDSPAARLSRWISSRAKFWNGALWPEVGQALSALVVSGLIALTVALQLGIATFFITMLALACAPLETELGAEGVGKWPRAFGEITFPWLIGHAAVGQGASALPTWDSVALAIFFAFTYRGLLSLASSREAGFALANFSQIVVALILVVRGAILPAGFVGIGLIAQNLWQMAARRTETYDETYLPRIQWFVLAAMLVAALGVPH